MSRDTRKTEAYEWLRLAILSERYAPGQSLVEQEIARQLGMSRTPVREAIRELSREGLVEVVPHKGACVSLLSAQELLDIFDIKIRLEGLCAARAAERRDPPISAELRKALKEMAAAARAKDKRAYLQADERYHALIYQGARNERAHQIVSDLNALWHRMRAGMAALESRMETAIEEHTRIAKAVAEGDPHAAEEAMRTHLESVRDQICALLEDFTPPPGGSR